MNWMTLFEGLFFLYSASGILLAFYLGDFGLLPFHLMLTFGFGFVFYLSLYHSRKTASKNDETDENLLAKRIFATR